MLKCKSFYMENSHFQDNVFSLGEGDEQEGKKLTLYFVILRA